MQPDTFRVSRSTTRVLQKGHPWILPDADSDDPSRFRPGACVRVQGPGGRDLGWARMDGSGRIAARMWAAPGSLPAADSEEVPRRVGAALARREPLLARGSAVAHRKGQRYTDALRLIHGEADGLPGLEVDRLGPMLRLGLWGGACSDLVDRVVESLQEQFPGPGSGRWPVVEVRHAPQGGGNSAAAVRWWEPPEPDWLRSVQDTNGRFHVRERGLVFAVDPGLAEPTRPRPGVGLFLDQRENRARLAGLARRGGHWLNLFAHTGAFSVALLNAGAERVISVDLSAAYLRWLQENLELNPEAALEPGRHLAVRQEGRRYLASLSAAERFAGVVIDPPTAAAAGRRFWSIRRDLQPLVGQALSRLERGGVVLVCRNDRSSAASLRTLVERAAKHKRVPLQRLDSVGAGPDFPRLAEFPEGEPFVGILAKRT